MQPKKGKDFVKSLQELNAALSGLLQNMKKDVKILEKGIEANRKALKKPFLDRELRGNLLLQNLRKHKN